jgi:hypothetical protein
MRASICLPLYRGIYLLSRNVVEMVIYMQVHIDIGDHYIDLSRLYNSQNLKLVQETGWIMLLFQYNIQFVMNIYKIVESSYPPQLFLR